MTLALDRRGPREHSRLLELCAGVAIVLLVAALTHLSAILLIPRVATQDAYHVLEAGAGLNRMVLLPPSRPGDTVVPFRDPATIQGVCFFDVAKAPVRVRTRTQDGQLLTLSFRTPEGRVFYSMTDRAALRDAIDIRLVTSGELASIESTDVESDEGLPDDLRLKVPSPKGLMVATVLVARPSERADAEARIKAISCGPDPLPPRS